MPWQDKCQPGTLNQPDFTVCNAFGLTIQSVTDFPGGFPKLNKLFDAIFWTPMS